MSMVRAMVAASALLTVAFAPTPAAHADDPCAGEPGCPTFGYQVCQQIDSGLSSGQVAMNAMVAYGLDKMKAA